MAPRILDKAGLASYLSVSEKTVDKMIEEGRMPRPKRLTERRNGWDVKEVDTAIEQLPTVGASSDDGWGDFDAA
jgi:predicted DNA-binding transcriptional regulator AlpA